MKRSEKTRLTRERILKGAETTFLKEGYHGASMKRIAESCKLTQSLLHHHYSTKQQLWDAVLQHRFNRVIEELKPHINQAMRSEQVPAALLDVYIDYLEANPDYVQLLGWTSASQQTKYNIGLATPLVEILRTRQKQGHLRADLDPQSLLIALWSLAEGWTLGKARFAARMGKTELSTDELTTLRASFRALIATGTQPATD